MKIEILKTTYSRMPKSINNHTDKEFLWNGQAYFIDKETDTSPSSYRLWMLHYGTVLVLDYFCEGESWNSAIRFVEGFLTGVDKMNLELEKILEKNS